MNDLDARVAELAARYRPVAERILKEAIRIPADYVDRQAPGHDRHRARH